MGYSWAAFGRITENKYIENDVFYEREVIAEYDY